MKNALKSFVFKYCEWKLHQCFCLDEIYMLNITQHNELAEMVQKGDNLI